MREEDPGARAQGTAFAERIIRWQRIEGRHDLPWQGTRDPYRIWLSEIMLQQTQVTTVLDYYPRFLERFPDLAALAAAPLEAVLERWSGLGYYSRARHLHRCARLLMDERGGLFPTDETALAMLPGIGPSTAAAIAVFAFGRRAAILDGNVKRVLCRVHGIVEDPGRGEVERRLWARARAALPDRDLEAYTQGLMDLGATVCVRRHPACSRCPVGAICEVGRSGQWDRIPAPRARASLADREIAWLVLIDTDRVLVEERPGQGIWGGLLSLPEFDPESPGLLAERIERRLGLVPHGLCPLPSVRHSFTHFRLIAQPWLARVDHAAHCVAQTPPDPAGRTLRWLPFDAIASAALPRPVKQLLVQREAWPALDLPQARK
ncbi:MAG: A/G-specific adenine glycosylase [Pseudomonadota bacterium]|jgi:A/G-specific adenine glycosylase